MGPPGQNSGSPRRRLRQRRSGGNAIPSPADFASVHSMPKFARSPDDGGGSAGVLFAASPGISHRSLPHAGLACSSTLTGSVNANVEPLPGLELHPNSSAMHLDDPLRDGKPSPVPPFFLVIELSACWNS